VGPLGRLRTWFGTKSCFGRDVFASFKSPTNSRGRIGNVLRYPVVGCRNGSSSFVDSHVGLFPIKLKLDRVGYGSAEVGSASNCVALANTRMFEGSRAKEIAADIVKSARDQHDETFAAS
jgi:hypothetical protein